MAYSKFGSFANSAGDGLDEVAVGAIAESAVVNGYKRIKLSSFGSDSVEGGFNVTESSSSEGPEMTLRSLVSGSGIQIGTTNGGKALEITNTLGSSVNGNYYHLDGSVAEIKFGKVVTRAPSGAQLQPENYYLFGQNSTIKGVTDAKNLVQTGPQWSLQQVGFDCTLTVSSFAFGPFENKQYPNPIIGYADYTDPQTGIIYQDDFILGLSISGLPTFTEPTDGSYRVNIASLQFSVSHDHPLNARTGTSDGAVVNHTHVLGGFTGTAETSRSVGVSIKKFQNGTLELWLRHLSPGGQRLLNVTSASAMTIVWTAKGAVDGTLNPDSSGVIISANGLTSTSNAVARTTTLETKTTALEDAVLGKAEITYVDQSLLDVSTFNAATYVNYPSFNSGLALKANQSELANYYNMFEVNNALALKADTSYVDQGFFDLSVNFAGTYVGKEVYNSSLALKAPINNPTFTGTVDGVTKAMVGLGQVDNTSDVSKPISTATQTALALKADTTYVNSENAAQNTLITALRTVPYITIAHRTKSYTFQGAVPRALDGTGATVNILAGSGGSTIVSFNWNTATGYVSGGWTGTRYCNVLAQINFQYNAGANDNQVAIWLHNVGATLPGTAPTLATAVDSIISYSVVRNQANQFYTAQFNAILGITGGSYYTMGMQATNGITYNVNGVFSVQAIYGI